MKAGSTIREIKNRIASKYKIPRISQEVQAYDEQNCSDNTQVWVNTSFLVKANEFTEVNSLQATIDFKTKDNFFYSKEKTHTDYSNTPLGVFALDRFIKGKKYFKNTSLASQKEKMTLVLSDWAAPLWDQDWLNEVNKLLTHYRQQGFNIYIWQEDQLVLMDSELRMEQVQSIRPATSSTIYQKAKEKKLVKDQLYILKRHDMQCLMEGADEHYSYINLNDFNGFGTDKDSLIPILKQESIQKVYCNKLSKIPAAKELTLALGLSSPPGFKILEINEEELSKLSIVQNKLCIKDWNFEESWLEHVQKLSVIDTDGSPINTNKLALLISKCNNLKHLKLTDCSELEHWTSCPSLNILELQKRKLSSLDLKNLAQQYPGLIHLSLAICTFNNEDLKNWQGPPELATLNLSGTKVSSGVLESCFKNNSRLKTLDLSFCKALEEGDVLSVPTQHNLQTLILKSSSVTAQVLEKLLRNATSLKELNLSDCHIEGSLEPLSLTSLETLDLSHSTISAEFLYKLIKEATQLKHLDLTDCKITGPLMPVLLPLLETLTLDKGEPPFPNLSNQDLNNLLQGSEKLKSLSLYKYKDISGELDRIFLPSLETLNISDSFYTGENLHRLLQDAKNLRTLNISVCMNETAIDRVSLPSLESLVLNYANISSQDLKNLLQDAKQLKRLDLYRCFNLYNDLGKFSLLSLKELNLGETNISSQCLQNMLGKATNLKNLNLKGCRNIDENLGFLPLVSLTELNLTDSNVSTQNLYRLVSNAPNLKELHLTGCPQFAKKNLSQELTKLLDKIPEVWYPGEVNLDTQNNQVTNASVPINPKHDPKDMLFYQPTKQDFNFVFKGINKTKNQGMIIEKLSQYLKLTNKKEELIPKIQDGICSSLSHYFSSNELGSWIQFITQVASWDGQNIKDVQVLFDSLIPFIEDYQLKKNEDFYYLGEGLRDFLLKYQGKKPFTLINPWHEIAVSPLENKHWFFYDPNCIDGGREIESLDELTKAIQNSLGGLVSLGEEAHIKPEIKDASLFIEQGGLLALCHNTNSKELLELLQLNKEKIAQFPDSTFDGLLLRTVTGEPAWHCAERIGNTQVKELVALLKAEFNLRNSNVKILMDLSKKDMVVPQSSFTFPVEPQSSLASPAEPKPDAGTKATFTQKISDLPTTENLIKIYEKCFATWEKKSSQVLNVKAYVYKKLGINEHKKQLIELGSDLELQGMQAALLSHCKSISRPVFCVNSPEDLICSAPYMHLADNKTQKGHLVKGPGGPLHAFLQKKGKNNPVLLINYSNFDASDIVRFNALLDEQRKADGFDLPPSTQIIGLTNTSKVGYYQGSDFYSRLDHVDSSPLPAVLLAAAIPDPPFKEAIVPDFISINLFHTDDWKERLLGRWVMRGKNLLFEDGSLIAALQSGKPIQLENAPWEDFEWKLFWQQIQITGVIPRPEGFEPLELKSLPVLLKKDGYEWKELLKQSHWDTTLVSEGLVLNPTQLSQFFQRYECQEPVLNTLPGWLEFYKEKTLHLNLTRELSEDEWAQCFSQAQLFHVTLHIHCASGVALPFKSQINLQHTKAETTAWHDEAFVSTDCDTTIAELTEQHHPQMILDVSECTASDLFFKMDGKLNQDTLEFHFTQTESALNKALSEGKTVILTGTFSAEIKDSLDALLFARKANPKFKGRILLVSNEPVFPYITQTQQIINKEQKQKHLKATPKELQILETQIRQEPLAKLKARLNHLRRHPKESRDNSWMGLHHLPSHIQLDALDLNRSKELAFAFNQKRLTAINEVLDKESFVFLTGLTAVGKTTFVTKYLFQKNTKPFQGLSRIKEWAADTSSERKILFLDEANLSPNQWSEMEGLLYDPRGILIDGTYYPLDEHHKVVFAGNPVSYGDDRTLSAFFERHGNAILFDPLPLANIYEEILAPVFQGSPLESQTATLTKPILDVYAFLCERSVEEVLISPRELQMMALLISSYCSLFPKVSAAEVAFYYAYYIARPLVPKTHQEAFDALYLKPEELPRKPAEKDSPTQGGFVITPSRTLIKNQIDDLLHLRHYRREKALNEIQQHGGLGGIVLEGEPGCGKSESVTQALIQQGYQEVHNFFGPNVPDLAFYRMPVSMGLEDKERLLLKAFDEGSVVVIDEINSSPMMEQLLNSLLMGKTLQGQKAQKPGFLIIGTQNPITMAGRIAPSTALSRRLITVEVPEYTLDELHSILLYKGLTKEQAEPMIIAFNNQKQLAQANNFSPAPCFRDLIKQADQILAAQLASINTKVDNNEDKIKPVTLSVKELKDHPAFKELFHSIKLMEQYGCKLNKTHLNKGSIVVNLAADINKRVLDYLLKAGRTLPSEKDTEELKNTVKQLIVSKQQIMSRHRAAWKPIIANILLALTGIGLLAQIIHASIQAYRASKHSMPLASKNFFFFSKTKSQERIEDIEKTLNSTFKAKNPR